MAGKIVLAGDWHMNRKWAQFALDIAAKAGADRVLHVGDFGLFSGGDANHYRNVVNARARKHGITIYVTLGNHEDYSMAANLQKHPNPGADGDWFWDGKHENILYAGRATAWEWEGVKFMSLGGANSINRHMLRENIDWWPGEQITLGDAYRAREVGYVDVMITHEAPTGAPAIPKGGSGWPAYAIRYAEQSSNMLKAIVENVKPKALVHGHYHCWIEDTVDIGDAKDVHILSLHMDDSLYNLAVFNPEDLSFERIEYDMPDRRRR